MTFLTRKGITLVELIVVIGLIAVLGLAMYPLISTTYESWRTVDRRVELLQVGRVGMSKLGTEIRKAHDIYYCDDPDYIDLYPDWESDTAYRFNYNSTSTAKFLEFGTRTPFVNDQLAGPLTDFEYLSYARQTKFTGVSFRRASSFRFKYEVSDERHIAPPSLAPMKFHTFVNMRVGREGYYVARTSDFSSETIHYDSNNDPATMDDEICVKAFCDRLAGDATLTTARIEITCPLAPLCPVYTYNLGKQSDARGIDYYYTCLDWNDDTAAGAGRINTGTTKAWAGYHTLKIILSDGNENCIYYDGLKIVP